MDQPLGIPLRYVSSRPAFVVQCCPARLGSATPDSRRVPALEQRVYLREAVALELDRVRGRTRRATNAARRAAPRRFDRAGSTGGLRGCHDASRKAPRASDALARACEQALAPLAPLTALALCNLRGNRKQRFQSGQKGTGFGCCEICPLRAAHFGSSQIQGPWKPDFLA